MGILEIVFNSRKFDLNDDVLMGFDNYFDKKSKDYNSFCLDEEDINPLQNFVAQIKSADSDSVIYVLNITVRQSRQSGVARATCPD